MIIEKIKAKGMEISVLEGTDRLQYLIDIANDAAESVSYTHLRAHET